jgi:hypothetical protein
MGCKAILELTPIARQERTLDILGAFRPNDRGLPPHVWACFSSGLLSGQRPHTAAYSAWLRRS